MVSDTWVNKLLNERMMEEKKEKEKMVQEEDRYKVTELDSVFQDRRKNYGSFEGNARVMDNLLSIIYVEIQDSGQEKNLNAQHELALRCIAMKLSRLCQGNINHADSWLDIAGYAKLMYDFILKEGVKNEGN